MKVSSPGGLAVVTGAAGGLGSSFANQLAELGYRLLLIDRRQAELERVCESIAERHGTIAETCALDLCNREDLERLANRLAETEEVELLVNNAGFGRMDYFVDTDARCLASMIDLHVVAPTMLTRSVLPGMIQRNRGGIINVSSLSAWFHSAGNSHYGSTKNYLAVFSLALHEELRGTNVRVQALCPGFIRTPFHDAEWMRGYILRSAPAHFWMTADEVVNCSLGCLSSKQVIVVPGFGYRVLCRLARMPMVQPLMRWITRVPRLTPVPGEPVDLAPAPVLCAEEPVLQAVESV